MEWWLDFSFSDGYLVWLFIVLEGIFDILGQQQGKGFEMLLEFVLFFVFGICCVILVFFFEY